MWKERLAEHTFLKCLARAEHGEMRYTGPDGKVHHFKGNIPGPTADIYIHELEVLLNFARRGDVAFAEDYRDGKWDSDDLPALTHYGLINDAALDGFLFGTKMFQMLGRIASMFRANTLNGSKRNIQAHYDLGNDFYTLWLDPTMSYSSAIFETPSQSLESAQIGKYQRILSRLPQQGEVLEIGCGWGGFAEQAVQSDHRVTGITLSPSQHAYAEKRLQPYNAQASVVLEDYRKQSGRFDHIVSIEMFEAVGERYWPVYFEKMASLMKAKGRAVVQTITIDDNYFDAYRKCSDVIRTYIFPGGMLPCISRFNEEAQKAGLRITDSFAFGKDYAKTLEHWLATFDAKRASVQALGFDDRFIRLWRYYLAACIGAFNAGRTDVMQLELQHAA